MSTEKARQARNLSRPGYYTVTEAAEILGLHRNTIFKRWRLGRCQMFVFSTAPKATRYIPVEDVERMKAEDEAGVVGTAVGPMVDEPIPVIPLKENGDG